MKVLHVLRELNRSGAEVMLCSVAPFLKDRGITGEILSTGSQVGPYAETLANAGYAIKHIPFRKSPMFFFALFRLFQANAYDVIHLHTERANFWFGVLALMSCAKCIRTIHNNFHFSGFLRWERKWQRQLLNQLGVTHVAISQSVQDTERNYYQLPTRLITNWYNSHHFARTTEAQRAFARQQLDIPENCFVLVSVGNCSSVKNHSLLIEAIAKLKSSDTVYLHIGYEKDNSEQELAKKLSVSDRVRFQGSQEDVLPFLQAADLFVMPSLYEGCSIAVLEAIGTGLPVLLSKVSGLSDMEEFFDGLHYCEPTVVGIFEALRKIIKMPASDLTFNARENSDAAALVFGVQRGLDAYVECYKGLRPG